ncbi:hypothetical protein COZ22_00990 [bacterium (Candidatus Howlettbacteria) CG_4_10_14_3_um_filter_37_10]|nr:MAG: hypothetical protein COZ22_00990 [bacterium (Candidatus Howlettbacteria) CG_4_10_14_3_um_filter_37_10]
MREKIRKIASKKEFLIAAFLVLILVLIYYKDNPSKGVNWNMVSWGKSPASLIIVGPSEIPGAGTPFKVGIDLDTNNYLVNAIQANIEYDSRILEAMKLDTTDSFCKLYIENRYQNEKGLVKVACGAPSPGFKGKNRVMTIDFIAKSFSNTTIKVREDSMVTANDKKGTNILKNFDSKIIRVRVAV